MFPLAGPELAGPPLQRDRANGRPVFVANHFAPSARVSGSNLRGTFPHAEQSLSIGSQTCHGPPVLSSSRNTAHRCSSPPGARCPDNQLRGPINDFAPGLGLLKSHRVRLSVIIG
jgi:hypothetical protein